MNVVWDLEVEDARLVMVALNAAAQRARERAAQGEQEQASASSSFAALHDELSATIQAARMAAGRPGPAADEAGPTLRGLRARLRDQPPTHAARVADLLDLVELLVGSE